MNARDTRLAFRPSHPPSQLWTTSDTPASPHPEHPKATTSNLTTCASTLGPTPHVIPSHPIRGTDPGPALRHMTLMQPIKGQFLSRPRCGAVPGRRCSRRGATAKGRSPPPLSETCPSPQCLSIARSERSARSALPLPRHPSPPSRRPGGLPRSSPPLLWTTTPVPPPPAVTPSTLKSCE